MVKCTGHHQRLGLPFGALPFFDTRQVEDRMLKSEKEQMPHNPVRAQQPSSQGVWVGVGLTSLCFGKPSLSL